MFLRTGGADEGPRVPAGIHRDFLNVHPGLRGVDDVAVPDVHGDVTDAVVVQQVAGQDGRRGDVRQGRPLLVGVPRDRDPGRRPGGLGQPGAVEAGRPGRAPLVGLAERVVGEGYGLVRLGRGRPGVGGGGGGVRGWSWAKATALSAWVVVGPV